MTKKERFNSEFQIINKETGEAIDDDNVFDIVKSISIENRKSGLIKKSKNLTKNVLTFVDKRRFRMIFEDDSIKESLGVLEIGIYSILCSKIDESGSCIARIEFDNLIVDSYRKLFKYLKIGFSTGKKAMDNLIEANIIQIKIIGKKTVFYVNPLYYRYGNEITQNVAEMFNIPFEYFK